MKTSNLLLTALVLIGLMMLPASAVRAQTCDGTGSNFVDLDGDGFNDNAPDFDGDGIPNGLDEDYVKNAQDGTGYQNGKNLDGGAHAQFQNRARIKSQTFNQARLSGSGAFQVGMQGNGAFGGPGTGICDGSGGASAGSGICDGTGPHGRQQQGGK